MPIDKNIAVSQKVFLGHSVISTKDTSLHFLDKNHILAKIVANISTILAKIFPSLARVEFKESRLLQTSDNHVHKYRASIRKSDLDQFISQACKSNLSSVQEKAIAAIKDNLFNALSNKITVQDFFEKLSGEIDNANKTVIAPNPNPNNTPPIIDDITVKLKESSITGVSEKIFGSTKVVIKEGKILQEYMEPVRAPECAIVHAAKTELAPSGALYGKGGKIIFNECEKIKKANQPPMQNHNLPTGKAVITTGGKIQAKIIHTVGPLNNDPNREVLLHNAYTNTLKVAADNGIKTLAFCSISEQSFGYAPEAVAKVAIKAIKEFCEKDQRIPEVRVIIDPAEMYAKDKLVSYQAELSKA